MRAWISTAALGGATTFQLGISWVNGCEVCTQGEVQRAKAHLRPAELRVPRGVPIRRAPPEIRVPSLVPDASAASVVNARNACWPAVEEAASRARSGVTPGGVGSVRTAPTTTRRREPTASTCGRSEGFGADGTEGTKPQ